MSYIKLDLLNDKDVKSFIKENKIGVFDPIVVINMLKDKYGIDVNKISNNSLLSNLINTKLFSKEDEIITGKKKNKIDFLNYVMTRKINSSKFIDNMKNYEIFQLLFDFGYNEIVPFLVVLDNNRGFFRLYIGNSSKFDHSCGYMTVSNRKKFEGTNAKKYIKNFDTSKFVDLKFNYSYIDWIIPKNNCGVLYSGKNIVNMFINLSKIFNVHRIDLQDDSHVECIEEFKNKKPVTSRINFNKYKILKDNKSWYENFGFVPSVESDFRSSILSINRNILDIYLPPTSLKSTKVNEYKKQISFLKDFENDKNIYRNTNLYVLYEIIEILISEPNKYINGDISKELINKLIVIYFHMEKFLKENNKKDFIFHKFMTYLYDLDCSYYSYVYNIITGDDTSESEGPDILDALIDFGSDQNINTNKLVDFRNTIYTLDSVNYYYLILKNE